MSIIETTRDIGPNVKRTYSPKSCGECQEEFIPTSGTQKFDSVCEPIVRTRRRRERYNSDENYRRRLIALNYRSELKRRGKNPDLVIVPRKVEPVIKDIPGKVLQGTGSDAIETEIQSEDVLAVEKSFADVAKRLQERKYRILMPVFKEGEDGDGVQVYFSPKGHLCYKPLDKEFKIETDVATDIYGKEKILQSLASALSLRKI